MNIFIPKKVLIILFAVLFISLGMFIGRSNEVCAQSCIKLPEVQVEGYSIVGGGYDWKTTIGGNGFSGCEAVFGEGSCGTTFPNHDKFLCSSDTLKISSGDDNTHLGIWGWVNVDRYLCLKEAKVN